MQFDRLKRREFITLLGGAAAAWPLAARAQQPQRVRRIGVFMPGVADDVEFQAFNAAFLQRLAELGWIVGRNVRIEYRWGAGDTERYRAIAAELVRAHGGEIHLVEGTIGATFRIAIPDRPVELLSVRNERARA